MKQEIEMHLHEEEKLKNNIPSHVMIGPFWVTCEPIRQMLSKKRKALASSVLEVLAKRLRQQADEVCAEFKSIERTLFDKPNGIEELTEQREYMKTLPVILTGKQELINKAMLDYELIEEFYYSISVDDFNAKYVSFVFEFFFMYIQLDLQILIGPPIGRGSYKSTAVT